MQVYDELYIFNTYIKRNTIDIDTSNKEFIEMVTRKIAQCSCLKNMCIKYSNSKGFHITIHCLINCDVCRLVFDDFRRFGFDSNRKECFKNILFDKKEKVKICEL